MPASMAPAPSPASRPAATITLQAGASAQAKAFTTISTLLQRSTRPTPRRATSAPLLKLETR